MPAARGAAEALQPRLYIEGPGSAGIVKGIEAAKGYDSKQMCLIQEYEMQGLPEAMEQQQENGAPG
ncbi:hypothetical protein GCM10023188_43400 [Pontibacter saemangeumensis]|uniref:Uncharacterized protein n=1 Tax=Pontibacter saemangeumensis TaxID=1084525 RepID=A0ABP8M222_9BACT